MELCFKEVENYLMSTCRIQSKICIKFVSKGCRGTSSSDATEDSGDDRVMESKQWRQEGVQTQRVQFEKVTTRGPRAPVV